MNPRTKSQGRFAIVQLLLIIAIIGLVAAIAIPVRAAQVNPFPPIIKVATNLPAIINAGSISNQTSIIPVTPGKGLSLQWKYNASAGTSNAVLYLFPSGDGTNFWTTGWPLVAVCNTNNTYVVGTNWSRGALDGIVAFNVGGITNSQGGTGIVTNKGLTFTVPGQ